MLCVFASQAHAGRTIAVSVFIARVHVACGGTGDDTTKYAQVLLCERERERLHTGVSLCVCVFVCVQCVHVDRGVDASALYAYALAHLPLCRRGSNLKT